MSGQWSLSKPGAASMRSLSMFSVKRLLTVSSVSASHGMANSFSPMVSTPPDAITA
jgi:hypothetical protein